MTTSNSESSVDRSLVSGLAWTAISRWGAQLISWGATLYAARRLEPADYGLVSMAMIAIGMARMVEDLGMDSILVQDRRIVGETQSRLAGFLIGVGVGLCVLFASIAQFVAVFFKEPQLVPMVRVLSLLFIFDAVQVVPRAQLQRTLQFRRLGLVAFVQVAATSATLVASVLAGFGYWSLVFNNLVGAAVTTALLICWCPYSIAWPRQIAKMAAPLRQGWRILSSRAAWYGYSSADQTIIGRVLGKDELGAYSFAVTFSSVAMQEIGSIISRVVPGIFSEVQEDCDALRRYFLLLTEFLTVLVFPLTIGLAVTADLVVALILGPAWQSVVVPLRLLCLYTAFLAAQLLVSHVLLWTGRFRAYMWCTILSGVVMPVAFLVGVRYGLNGMGWAWLVAFPLSCLPAMWLAFRAVRISTGEFLDSLKPAASGCVIMAAAVLALRIVLPGSLPLVLRCVFSVAVGGIVYPIVIKLVFGARIRRMIEVARAVRRQQLPEHGVVRAVYQEPAI